jgi:hypothetical protein
MHILIIIVLLVIIIAMYEMCHWFYRHWQRSAYYKRAKKRSIKINKKLLVVGSPEAGPSNKLFGANYGCGDICIDIK